MRNFGQTFDNQYYNLNTAQRQAVDAIYGTVMVLAGPGTGKTQVLAMRIANLLLQPDTSPYNILCLTFSNSGVSAMKRRLFQLIGPEANNITVSTFHAFCNQIIIENPLYFGSNKPLRQIQELDKIEIMDNILYQLPYNHPFKSTREDYTAVRKRLLNFLKFMEDEGVQPEKMFQWFDNYRDAVPELYENLKTRGKITKKGIAELERIDTWRTAVDIAVQYQQAVQIAGLYDYNDMINQVIQVFRQEENLLARYQERYQFVLVDEYQDTNGAQNQVLELLMGYWENPNLFIVGDDDQAIYRFQGANASNLVQVIERFPPQTFVVLDKNYRSTQPILNAAMLVINNLKSRLVNFPEIKKNYSLEKILQSQVQQLGEIPVCYVLDSEDIEIFFVCDLIHQKLQQNTSPDEIAVLVRKHKHADKLFKILTKQQIPISLSKTTNLLEEKFTKNILSFLEYLLKSYDHSFLANEDNEKLFRLLLSPWWEFDAFSVQQAYTAWEQQEQYKKRNSFYSFLQTASQSTIFDFQIEKTIIKLVKNLSIWIKKLHKFSFEEWIEHVWFESGIINYSLREPTQLAYVDQLKSLFILLQEQFSAYPEPRIVLERIRKMNQEGLEVPITTLLGESRGVRISTLHGAKGEEYNHVIMINNSKKYWTSRNNTKPFLPPIAYLEGFQTKNQVVSTNDESTDDERRLFYVGMTRAKSSLTFTYSTERLKDERLSFLSEIIAENQCVEESIDSKVAQNLVRKYLLNSFDTPELDTFETLPAQYFSKKIESFQLSVTHLNDFFECPRKFYLTRIIQLPTAFSPDSAFGTAIHNALCWLMETYKKHIYLPEIESLIQIFTENIAKYQYNFTAPKFKTYTERGKIILSNYYQHTADTWRNLKFWKTEQTLNTQLSFDNTNAELTGKLDLIFQNIDNEWFCIDYKTGKADKSTLGKRTQRPSDDVDYQQLSIKTLSEAEPKAFGGNYWRQMTFYQLLTSKHAMYSASKYFQFHVLEAKETENIFQNIPITTADKDIVINQIQFFYKHLRQFNFPKKDSSFQKTEPCSLCSFKEICW